MPLSDGATPHPSDAGPDENAAARQFALSIPEEDLFQLAQTRFAPYIFYPPERPMVFVKSGGPQRQGEGDMQILAFNWLRQVRQENPDCNIHVPEVFKIFSRGRLTFIIMQLVEAAPVLRFAKTLHPLTWNHDKSRYCKMIAEGVYLLSLMPVPADATPGPYTCGERRIGHLLFSDFRAPIVYPTIQQLEDHLNRVHVAAATDIWVVSILAKRALQVAERGYRRNPHPPRITLEKKLIYCYTDFNDENFMFAIDPDGRIRLYIIDFEHASFLPPSLLTFAIFEPGHRWFLCPWIAEKFGSSLPKIDMEVMNRIFYMFQISGGTVGLRERKSVPATSRQ
ncbi:hypothetical protein VTH06DRAFT_4418 [Thermothelomyces fergusii]